ncbi:hypothetical protein [Methylocella tundrae]|uniref:Uncharacterized protein n=1 Tax=Methylocella tundrae TaxID=227605 RepID=A0A4U8Z8Q2_METTU|nr:hypothetical protein [Methylocella tundrae]WPP02771.1 hypothetical protein SIN04_00240 [Methylocella tundrae]VFU17543.1 conserved protein of unknown function [Methylocella tundrae]
MIDFSTLPRPKSAAERQRDEDQRVTSQVADDLKRRREWNRKSVALTLVRQAEWRYTNAGTSTLQLRGERNDGRPIAITWFAPEHYTQEQINAVYNQLTKGSRTTVEGYWGSSARDARLRTTFVAQFIQIGDTPRVP